MARTRPPTTPRSTARKTRSTCGPRATPITRYRAWLEGRGASARFFAEVDEEAQDVASDVRRRALSLAAPTREKIFEHVYSEVHPPVMEAQYAWLDAFERSLDEEPA